MSKTQRGKKVERKFQEERPERGPEAQGGALVGPRGDWSGWCAGQRQALSGRAVRTRRRLGFTWKQWETRRL